MNRHLMHRLEDLAVCATTCLYSHSRRQIVSMSKDLPERRLRSLNQHMKEIRETFK